MIKNNKIENKNQKSKFKVNFHTKFDIDFIDFNLIPCMPYYLHTIRHRPWLLAISLLAMFLLFAGAKPVLAQTCVATQYRTDNGLINLEKGRKAKLLIGGIWYCCEGCGPSIPLSNPNDDCDHPQSAARPSTQLKPRPPKQELSDEQIIQLIERTKSLHAQVMAEDKVRQRQEHFAFLDKVSLLSRELMTLENAPLPQFNGFKLRLQDLNEKATTINEMANIARWSLIAAKDAKYGDRAAREKAGWGFDQWTDKHGRIDLSAIAPVVPLPESETPQFKAFKYIADWTADMRVKLLRLAERITQYSMEAYNLKDKSLSIKATLRSDFQPAPLTTHLTEEQKKQQEARAAQEKQADDLVRQAEALLKESEEMGKMADKYDEEINKMFKEFSALVENPIRCSSFLQEHLIGK